MGTSTLASVASGVSAIVESLKRESVASPPLSAALPSVELCAPSSHVDESTGDDPSLDASVWSSLPLWSATLPPQATNPTASASE
jgi:hypothetical protein